MLDSALALAAMRASRTVTLTERERDAAEAAAARLGRRIVEVHASGGSTTVTLGFSDGYEPNPVEEVFAVRRLSPIPLITLAACFGLCWPDPNLRPHLGPPTTTADVLKLTSGLGASSTHVRGALRNELAAAGLIELVGDHVRLGPAIAAWTDTQLDALRRFSDVLPRADA